MKVPQKLPIGAKYNRKKLETFSDFPRFGQSGIP
jgi:hypothetical protein